MKRTIEFLLTLIGGLLGMACSTILLLAGNVALVIGVPDKLMLVLGTIAMLSSILVTIISIVIDTKPKLAGVLLIICAIIGFICLSILYILPGILIMISSLLCILRKSSYIK